MSNKSSFNKIRTLITETFFHLIDHVTAEKMEKTMHIAMCTQYHINSPNFVEIFEKELLGGRVVKKYARDDSYCKVRNRWRYGTTGKNAPKNYDGDEWSPDEKEFYKQNDERRCPYCEAIYENIPFERVLRKRAIKKFGL
jgi:hypothetical protein